MKLVIILAALMLLTACSNTPSTPPRAGIGEQGEISSDVGALVATDEEAEVALTKGAVAKDNYALAELMRAGRVFSVVGHTQVLVIDTSGLTSRVRIQSGPMKGRAGWVPYEFVGKVVSGGSNQTASTPTSH